MKTLTTAVILGAMVVAGPPALAQAQQPAAPVYCGGPAGDDDYEIAENDISACEVDPLLADAGNALGIVRNDTLILSNTPRLVMTGYTGTWVDIEANPAGPAAEITRYEYAPDLNIPGMREDVTLANGDRHIHVVKADRAWDESPEPGFNPEDITDPAIVALRQARVWLAPHAIVRAAAFATKGLCPTNDPGDSDELFACPDHSTTVDGTSFTTTIYGMEYHVTTGEEDGIAGYPTTVSVTVNGMEIMRTYSGYHDGKGTGDDDSAAILLIERGASAEEIAAATAVVDEFRFGVYYPTHITETVNGNTTLDVEITSGWTNKYVPLPDPELLRAAAGG